MYHVGQVNKKESKHRVGSQNRLYHQAQRLKSNESSNRSPGNSSSDKTHKSVLNKASRPKAFIPTQQKQRLHLDAGVLEKARMSAEIVEE